MRKIGAGSHHMSNHRKIKENTKNKPQKLIRNETKYINQLIGNIITTENDPNFEQKRPGII